ncbi:hypothetical protein [Planococcus sp. ISL-110]|uniref:hypothetical protein n=1 Tax=Planococcus sp. ISL-110 TaxID=2819167 RepID=UPI001BE7D0C8|nr:hypothetical protein [Planococcus sp. ISL-110]MBT2572221.1 hypothetical protein [Planococcus sp. ISL-110]
MATIEGKVVELKITDESARSYTDSPDKLKKLSQRILFVVSFSRIFGGAGLASQPDFCPVDSEGWSLYWQR